MATEAVAGTLPIGRNSPQQVAHGLYAEQISGSAFTAPRGENVRTWMYRIRPSVVHKPFVRIEAERWKSGPFNEVPPTPSQMRWSAPPIPSEPTDFIDGIITVGGNGDPSVQSGLAIHLYAANASMENRFFYNADAEMLIVPQHGSLELHTECGLLEVAPLSIAVIPRGMKFRTVLPDGEARGYICENYGEPFRLPDLGPIGANFGAGMTGGMAYLYDPEGMAQDMLNMESLVTCTVTQEHWEAELKDLIERHVAETKSRKAQDILQHWDLEKGNFLQVCPKEMLNKIAHPLGIEDSVAVPAE